MDRNVDEDSLNEWEKRWAEETHNGAWTRLLMPNIIPWIKRKHRELDYYLNDLLSGYGLFN